MTTEIPDEVRVVVKWRARFRCEACGVPAPAGHWHHRRSRSVRDQHQHCACNGLWMCGICHRRAHEHPAWAQSMGIIVSRFVTEPGTVQVVTPWGNRTHTCDGAYVNEQIIE